MPRPMLNTANPAPSAIMIRIGSQTCMMSSTTRPEAGQVQQRGLRPPGACESFLNRSTPECYHNRFVMRVAWFSPFPPVRTGIAACSAELVAALRQRGHEVDPYPEGAAHDFVWRRRRAPYDLVVYQFGNSSHHDYEWAYALNYPGLVVLHDTRLHHARAAFLLRERRVDDYRADRAHRGPRDAWHPGGRGRVRPRRGSDP